MNKILQLVIAALLMAVSFTSRAADGNAALYDAVAPADSAYVRVLNLGSSVAEVLVSGKTASQKVSNGQLGAYIFVAPGSHQVKVNQASLDADLKPNSAITLLFDGSNLVKLEDTYSDDTKKALVAFYNLTDSPLALKTQDGKHVIVDALDKNQTGTRKINEVKISFAAYKGDANVAKFEEIYLKKGRSYSYVIFPEGGQIRTLSQANTIDSIE